MIGNQNKVSNKEFMFINGVLSDDNTIYAQMMGGAVEIASKVNNQWVVAEDFSQLTEFQTVIEEEKLKYLTIDLMKVKLEPLVKIRVRRAIEEQQAIYKDLVSEYFTEDIETTLLNLDEITFNLSAVLGDIKLAQKETEGFIILSDYFEGDLLDILKKLQDPFYKEEELIRFKQSFGYDHYEMRKQPVIKFLSFIQNQ